MDNIDDFDFVPSGNTRLASLFDTPLMNSEVSNLTYTAPKQPKPGGVSDVKQEPSKTNSNVICARVVHVWKLIGGKYNFVGKLGLAIIGSSTQSSYEMILYKEKCNVIARAKISYVWEISLKKNNFVSFYDSSKDNWLVKFNNEDDCTVVVAHIEKLGARVLPQIEGTKEAAETKPDKTQLKPENFVSEDAELTTNVSNDSFESKAKTDILTRIAKMGQSILPSKSLEIEDNISAGSSGSKNVQDQQMVSSAAIKPCVGHVQAIPNTVIMGPPMAYDPMNLYFSENRTHNTEVRMNLAHMSEKINTLMKLVDCEKQGDVDVNALKSKIKVLDLRNENLTKDLGKILEENRKLLGQTRLDSTLTKSIEDSKNELKLFKEQEEARICILEKELNVHKSRTEEVSQQLKNLSEELYRKDIIINQLEETVKNLEEATNPPKVDDDYTGKDSRFSAALKASMNDLYGAIMEGMSKQQTSEMSSIIAQNIKSTTVQIMHNFQQICKPQSESN